jgi:hypothetical protein
MGFSKVFKDACGACCACITYLLIFYGDYAITFRILWPWKLNGSFAQVMAGEVPLTRILSFLFYVTIFNVVCFLAVLCHARTMLSDPGYLPKLHPGTDYLCEMISPTSENKGVVCRKCNKPKVAEAHHCSVCKDCVLGMDHHCPWVNNCVARGNQKYFILFLLYIGLSSLLALCYLAQFTYACSPIVASSIHNYPRTPYGRGHMPPRVVRALEHIEAGDVVTTNMLQEKWTLRKPLCGKVGAPDDLTILFIVTVGLEAVMFGIFVTIMMIDQISSILRGATYIDQLKYGKAFSRNKDKGKIKALASVFGPPSKWWLLPVSPSIAKPEYHTI